MQSRLSVQSGEVAPDGAPHALRLGPAGLRLIPAIAGLPWMSDDAFSSVQVCKRLGSARKLKRALAVLETELAGWREVAEENRKELRQHWARLLKALPEELRSSTKMDGGETRIIEAWRPSGTANREP